LKLDTGMGLLENETLRKQFESCKSNVFIGGPFESFIKAVALDFVMPLAFIAFAVP
jgi:hypothetical protein